MKKPVRTITFDSPELMDKAKAAAAADARSLNNWIMQLIKQATKGVKPCN